jgi:hypothetical protein
VSIRKAIPVVGVFVTAVTAALVSAPSAVAVGAHAEGSVSAGGTSGALACHDHAKSYSKPAGDSFYPGGSAYLTTTSYCRSINIKPKTDRYIRVCFHPSSGSNYCQDSYKLAQGGKWNEIATDVLNGAKFWFDFRSDALSNGSWAA